MGKKESGNTILNFQNKLISSKKAAEMTIGTIIVIILALIVLVVIVYGFTTGWGNLWQKITGLGGGKEDVQTHIEACRLACVSDSKVDYCKNRDITFEKGVKKVMTCEDLAKDPQYGLDPCPIVCRDLRDGSCASFKGKWQKEPCSNTQIQIPLTIITNAVDRGDNDYCCKTTCSSIKGTWSLFSCAEGYVNKYDELTDKEEGNIEGATNCCVAKITR